MTTKTTKAIERAIRTAVAKRSLKPCLTRVHVNGDVRAIDNDINVLSCNITGHNPYGRSYSVDAQLWSLGAYLDDDGECVVTETAGTIPREEYEIPVLSTEAFSDSPLAWDVDALADRLAWLLLATDQESCRYALAGIAILESGSMVATDARRLHLTRADMAHGVDVVFLLPYQAVKTLCALLAASIDYCCMSLDEKREKARFTGEFADGRGNWTYDVRGMEGRFPKWQDVVGNEYAMAPKCQLGAKDVESIKAICKRVKTWNAARSEDERQYAIELGNDYVSHKATKQHVALDVDGLLSAYVDYRFVLDVLGKAKSAAVSQPKKDGPIYWTMADRLAITMPMERPKFIAPTSCAISEVSPVETAESE